MVDLRVRGRCFKVEGRLRPDRSNDASKKVAPALLFERGLYGVASMLATYQATPRFQLDGFEIDVKAAGTP